MHISVPRAFQPHWLGCACACVTCMNGAVALGELKHKLIKGDPTKKSQAGKPGAGDDKKAAKPGA